MADVKVSVNVDVDVLGIWNKIEGYICVNLERESWVKNAREVVFNELGERYNVLVFNLGQNYEWKKKDGVVLYRGVKFNNNWFGIWAFESGEFDNLGNLGFQNWAFEGNWKRSGEDGRHVSFQLPDKSKKHTVVRGDTLYDLATRYGCTEKDIMAWNEIDNADALRIGIQIRVRR